MVKPLTNIKVIEFEGIGPGPLAGRILSDYGADVIVVVKSGPINAPIDPSSSILRDGKKILNLDLKNSQSIDQVKKIISQSDVLLEGNRPGVMERLGLGPDVCHRLNSKLIYGRMTGWGQTGPLSSEAGHDLNYLAVSGVFSSSISQGKAPIPPTLGDGVGALSLVAGVSAALVNVAKTGQGCVIDAAILDSVTMLNGIYYTALNSGQVSDLAPSPFHNSPFYDVYECADGKYISVAAAEPHFFKNFIDRLGLQNIDLSDQYNSRKWPEVKQRISSVIRAETRDHWCNHFSGFDACVAPVLTIHEAISSPQNQTRRYLMRGDDAKINFSSAPRFTGYILK